MAPVSLIPAQKYSNTIDSNPSRIFNIYYFIIIFAGKINPDQSPLSCDPCTIINQIFLKITDRPRRCPGHGLSQPRSRASLPRLGTQWSSGVRWCFTRPGSFRGGRGASCPSCGGRRACRTSCGSRRPCCASCGCGWTSRRVRRGGWASSWPRCGRWTRRG